MDPQLLEILGGRHSGVLAEHAAEPGVARVIRQKVTCTSVVVKSVTGINADGDVVRFGIFIVSANPRGGGRYATIRFLCFRGSIRLSDCGRTCGEKKTQAQKNGGEKK